MAGWREEQFDLGIRAEWKHGWEFSLLATSWYNILVFVMQHADFPSASSTPIGLAGQMP